MGEKISFIDLFGTELELEDEYAREQLSGEAAARAEDVAVLSARMDTFTALPDGSTAGDAELTDIRVGSDGVTYASAGSAVREQVTDLKSNIAHLGTDGAYIVDLPWEHGGIDNATGELNNEGSTDRSRVSTFMECADYSSISNTDESQNLWVIYYDDNYNFKTSNQILNDTLNIRKNYSYFRLDYRRGLNYTNNIKLYKYAEFEKSLVELENKSVVYDEIVENMTKEVAVDWEQGTLADASGEEGSSTIRIRFADFLKISPKNSIRLIANNGYIFQVYTWDDNKIYQGTSSDLSSYVQSYKETSYIKIVLKKSNGEIIIPTEGSNLNITLLGIQDNENDAKIIPSYWIDAITEAETSINNYLASDEKSASFGFVTDTHIGINNGYSGLLMKKVLKDCHIPMWFHGGDAVSGAGIISKENLIEQMNADFEQFAPIENIGLRAIGNHDPAFGITNNYDSNLNSGEINLYYHGVDCEKYLQVYGEGKGYFYKDIHKDKLRCIVLDIIPYESQVNTDDVVTGVNKMYYHQFGQEQLEWFIDVLANTPKNYSVVVCSHIAPVSLGELQTLDNSWSETCPVDYLQARKIAEAYKLKTTYAFDGTVSGDQLGVNYNIRADFTNANGEFVCFFCGHTHKDFDLTLDNVLIVGTANDSISVSTNATAYAPAKTTGTDTEHVLDFFCVQPTNHNISVVRLGAYLPSNGKVRNLSY